MIDYYLAMGSHQRILWEDPDFQEELPIETLNIMRTCLDFYENKNKGFKDNIEEVFLKAKSLMLDSGGYNLLKKKNISDYPWTVYAYHNFLERVKPHIAVSMDYNTSIIFERDGEKEYYEQKDSLFEKTIDNFISQYDMDRDYELMIAVQGVPLEDKIEFLDLLNERIDLSKVEWFGYGGRVVTEICGSLISYIKRKAPKYKFHMLGATFSQIENLITYGIAFHSFDTITWMKSIHFGQTIDDNGDSILIKFTNQSSTEVTRRLLKHSVYRFNKLVEKEINRRKREKPLF